MSVERLISMESSIYHQPSCRYVTWIKDKNLMTIKQDRAQRKGFRPCKCCNTMSHRYKNEKSVIDFFDTKKGLDFLYSRNSLYVKTNESCWKLVYLPEEERIGMFHRNHSSVPVNFEEPWKERYHRQNDRFKYCTIEDALYYIYDHDRFRAAINAGEKDPLLSSKKYKNSARRAIKKREQNRLDDLFRMIENQFSGNGDFRQYSIC